MIPKSNPGRRGYPRYVIEELAADYRRLGSARAVALLHGRSPEGFRGTLKRLGITQDARKRLPAVEYKGERFTPDHQGFLRSTTAASRTKGRRRVLHNVIWAEVHGPVPSGSMLVFKDGNRANCALENLRCVTRAEYRAEKETWHGNAWSQFYVRKNAALDAWQTAVMECADAETITKARERYEGINPPKTHSEERRAAARSRLAAQWAAHSIEDKAARVAKAAANKKARRLERMEALT